MTFWVRRSPQAQALRVAARSMSGMRRRFGSTMPNRELRGLHGIELCYVAQANFSLGLNREDDVVRLDYTSRSLRSVPRIGRAPHNPCANYSIEQRRPSRAQT